MRFECIYHTSLPGRLLLDAVTPKPQICTVTTVKRATAKQSIIGGGK